MLLKDLIPESDYAAMRGVCLRTIQRDRALRTGPAYIKVGRNVFYWPAAIDDWLLAQEQTQPRAKVAA